MASGPILVDTSIWVDHFNKGDAAFASQLKRRRVIIHPMVIGEIALGSVTNRRLVMQELHILPLARPAGHAEVMAMIEWLELGGTGVGYVDVHLLATARQLPNCLLWTRDKKLRAQAERLGVAFAP